MNSHWKRLIRLVWDRLRASRAFVRSLSSARNSDGWTSPTPKRFDLTRLVPWFITGFLTLVACRSLGLVPAAAIAPISYVATLLTVVSMAALGLGVDVRVVAKAGGQVTTAVILSLLGLGVISLALLSMLHIA